MGRDEIFRESPTAASCLIVLIKGMDMKTPTREASMEEYPLLNLFWTMLMIFVFVIWIWVVISVFADNFRRTDHSGWAKAGWTLLIVVFPIVGVLIYMIARPRMTKQDKQLIEQYEQQQKRLAGTTPAQEIERLHKLKEQGAITAEEYEKLKAQAMA
ncbi:MAG TPA: SHOCT domain-containing protein [Actinobacteria bacterium]|nr:SHOCT domain-containing protein [Actinomycetota bacterium]